MSKVLAQCFANTTTFINEHMMPVNTSSIRVGDIVHTIVLLDAIENNAAKWVAMQTKVTVADKIDGPFRFVRIQLAKNAATGVSDETATLTVTESHGVIVLGEATDEAMPSTTMTETVPAMDVSVGQKMLGVTGLMDGNVAGQNIKESITIDTDIWVVKLVDFVTLPWKHVVQTEAGTALASGLLTTTSCVH